MIRATALLLALTALPAAAEGIGPGAVFDGGFDCRPERGELDAYLACLKAEGASAEAIAASAALAAPKYPIPGGYDEVGVINGFREHGIVDVAEIFIPGRANTNDGRIFVNGVWPFAHPYDFLIVQAPSDAGSLAVLRRHPGAAPSGRVGIGAHRLLPDGTQRFTVTDILTDGCRACEIAGTLVADIEFRDGRYSGGEIHGYAPMEFDMPPEAAATRIAGGDVALMQFHLNLAGYRAGSMDGHAGPATRDALAEFQSTNCLAASGALATAAAVRLVAEGAGTAQPGAACAAQRPVQQVLPGIAPGYYAADVGLCEFASVTDRFMGLPEAERSRLTELYLDGRMGFDIRDDGIGFGHGACSVAGVAPEGPGLRADLVCSGETVPPAMALSLVVWSDGLLTANGRLYQRCGS